MSRGVRPAARAGAPSRCGAWLLSIALLLAGCVAQAAPGQPVSRTEPPPWPAPRDGLAQFQAAGVPSSRLDDRTGQRTFRLNIAIDGTAVVVTPWIGLDRPRALQAPAHTHDESGTVWLEGRGVETVTLGQFFVLWGVRFDDRCLGAACGTLRVLADGAPVADPENLRLAGVTERVEVQVRTR